jgi:hypothetical protein
MGSRILALTIGAHPGLFPDFHVVNALPGIIRHAGQGVSEICRREAWRRHAQMLSCIA